jgi:hypothetical protein
MIVTIEAQEAWCPSHLQPRRVHPYPVGVVDDRRRQPEDPILDLPQDLTVAGAAPVSLLETGAVIGLRTFVGCQVVKRAL